MLYYTKRVGGFTQLQRIVKLLFASTDKGQFWADQKIGIRATRWNKIMEILQNFPVWMKEARTCVLQEEMCKFIFALTCVCIMPNDKSKNI